MDTYNIYISTAYGDYNILGINSTSLEKLVKHYKKGIGDITIAGKHYNIETIKEIKIFTYEVGESIESFKATRKYLGDLTTSFSGSKFFKPDVLAKAGKDITEDIIGDVGFGEGSVKETSETQRKYFVNPTRIEELKSISTDKFDLRKLIRFCEELNSNYANDNYLSVAILSRSILNHIPPIFGFKTFTEVVSQHGGASFKKIANHLNITMRGISEGILHDTIRKKESLPNHTQINFSQDLDRLLEEVFIELNKKI